MNSMKKESGFLSGIASGRYSHAYLVSCPDFSRAHRLVRRAAALLCFGNEDREPEEYSDFWEFDSGELGRQDVIRLKSELSLSTYTGTCRVIIIKSVHLLNETLQNALLKTLEEPPTNTVLLLTGVESNLLPTIRSRCTKIRIPPLDGDVLKNALCDMGANDQNTDMLARACQGALDRAEAMLNDPASMELYFRAIDLLKSALDCYPSFDEAEKLCKDRADARLVVEFMLTFARDMLISKTDANLYLKPDGEASRYAKRFTIRGISGIIDVLVEADRRFLTNVRPQDTVNWMLIGIMRLSEEHRTEE